MSDPTAAESELHFPKLNDMNYVEWAMRMEADLIRRKLWDSIVEISIDESIQDPVKWQEEYEKKKKKQSMQKMNEARAEMIMAVDSGQLSHMRSCDLMEIWEMLAKVHKARGFATQLAMKRAFLTSKKKSTQSMQAWIGEVRSTAFHMEEMGIMVGDLDKIFALMMGLLASYEAVIITLDTVPTEELTLKEVIQCLLNEEVRQTSMSSSSRSTSTRDHGVAAAVVSTEKPRVNCTKVQCYFCDQIGHFKQDCPKKAVWETLKNKTTVAGANTVMPAATFSDLDNMNDNLEGINGAW